MLNSEPLSFEPELVRPLKRSEYDRMVELGLFPIHPAHPVSTRALRRHRARARCRGGALGRYGTEHSRTALLIIEVSDTTLRKDRTKAAVYASAGIGEYWIVNLGAQAVEVYLSPDGDRYAEVRTLRAGDVLRPAALPDIAIVVAEILPEA